METENKLVYSKENYYTENGYKYKIKTTISLDDDCHNNMCDWSITADIRWKNKYGIYKEYMGGCCHDEIARHCPELAKFIPLHGCNHYGAPLYPVEMVYITLKEVVCLWQWSICVYQNKNA